jgi:GrpB-like predicted nucleotidyltransferase (UPF0157 family)
MGKYTFKPYSPKFKKLYREEEANLRKVLPESVKIEHVGSSAVPGLGGKGIIDIAVLTPKNEVESYMNALQQQGYRYSPHPGDASDKFMEKVVNYSGGERRVHVHLTLDPNFWKSFLNVRDYLREHPDSRDEYARIKKEGAQLAEGDGVKYGNYKAEWVRNLARKAEEEARQKGKKGRLETIVLGVISIISFIFGIFLISSNIVGNAIGIISHNINGSGIILSLIGLICGFICIKRMRIK